MGQIDCGFSWLHLRFPSLGKGAHSFGFTLEEAILQIFLEIKMPRVQNCYRYIIILELIITIIILNLCAKRWLVILKDLEKSEV